jgi:hypothetical protein
MTGTSQNWVERDASAPGHARTFTAWAPVLDRLVDPAIVVAALVVRLWRLDYHSFWFDEAVSLRWAKADLVYTWQVTFRLVEEKHPPAYYTLLHLWMKMLEPLGLATSDVALRGLGGVLGALTVWGILRLAAETGTHASGRVSALLVALSPVLVWYSQELRMFQPATTGIVWCAYCLWRAWSGERALARALWWAGAVLCIEFALYSYLFSAFVLPAAGLTLAALVWRDRDWRRFAEGALALAVAGALFLPLARNAWAVNAAESTPGKPFDEFFANLLRLLQTDTTWRAMWPQVWITSALVFTALLLVIGLALPWPRGASKAAFDRPWLWIWLGTPVLIANLLLARSRSIFTEDRYLLFLAPFVLWSIGRGAVALAARSRGMGVLAGIGCALLLLSALPALWTPERARENWRAVADHIVEYQEASQDLPAAVVAHVDYTHAALEWYLRQAYDFDELPVFFPFGGALDPDDVDAVVAPPLNGLVDFGADTLWLTQSHLAGVDDDGIVEGWLAGRFPVITEQYPAGVKLTGYMLQSVFKEVPALGAHAVLPNAELAPGLWLRACEVVDREVAAEDSAMHPPSGWVHVRLWWNASEPLGDDYVATVQMMGPEGVWGDRLHRPNEALRMRPTSTWQVGEVYRDEVDVNLNPVTPPATYPIFVGVAGPDGQPVGPTVECGQVTVK